MSDDWVLAVDGGQSSTLALLAARDGTIRGVGKGGPANHIHEPGGMERMARTLRQVIAAAFESAGCAQGPVRSACFGMTGGAHVVEGVVREFLACGTLRAVHDAVTALAGASVAQPGVVVIAGTGAVAYGEDGQGRTAKAGGWGYVMGDEGSGYDIGIQALRAATQAADGRAPATRLADRIPLHFGVATLVDVHATIYSGAVERPRIAALAAVVGQAAADGDAAAQTILARAGADLAGAALAAIAQLARTETGLDVYPVGGVYQAGAWILDPFARALQAGSPASAVRVPAFTPVIGALLLALKDAGVPPEASVLERIRASMPPAAHSKVDGDETNRRSG